MALRLHRSALILAARLPTIFKSAPAPQGRVQGIARDPGIPTAPRALLLNMQASNGHLRARVLRLVAYLFQMSDVAESIAAPCGCALASIHHALAADAW